MPPPEAPPQTRAQYGAAAATGGFQPVGMQLWRKASTFRLLLFALGFAALIFLASVGMDGILLKEHEPRRVVIEVSDAFAGVVAGGLLYLYLRARRREVLRRLETIGEMNHHIRNALQVISASSYLPAEKREVEAINQSVERIQWALREILPKL